MVDVYYRTAIPRLMDVDVVASWEERSSVCRCASPLPTSKRVSPSSISTLGEHAAQQEPSNNTGPSGRKGAMRVTKARVVCLGDF